MPWEAIGVAVAAGGIVAGVISGIMARTAARAADLFERWVKRLEERIDIVERRQWEIKDQVPSKDDFNDLRATVHNIDQKLDGWKDRWLTAPGE